MKELEASLLASEQQAAARLLNQRIQLRHVRKVSLKAEQLQLRQIAELEAQVQASAEDADGLGKRVESEQREADEIMAATRALKVLQEHTTDLEQRLSTATQQAEISDKRVAELETDLMAQAAHWKVTERQANLIIANQDPQAPDASLQNQQAIHVQLKVPKAEVVAKQNADAGIEKAEAAAQQGALELEKALADSKSQIREFESQLEAAENQKCLELQDELDEIDAALGEGEIPSWFTGSPAAKNARQAPEKKKFTKVERKELLRKLRKAANKGAGGEATRPEIQVRQAAHFIPHNQSLALFWTM